jgi:hypothetical protein
MSDWSVGGIGGNVKAASFEGAALNMARILNLPNEITDFFMKQHKDLTSPFPLVGDIALSKSIQPGVEVAEAGATAGVPNIGKGGHSLA